MDSDTIQSRGGPSLARNEPFRLKDRSVLVIGLSPEVNRSVVQPLRDLGIAAEGTTQPDQASEKFDASDFELIVFERGVLGPLSDRLKGEFSKQNPTIRLIDVIGPVAVKQAIAALQHDPEVARFISEFRVVNIVGGNCILAKVLQHCRVTLTLFSLDNGRLATDVLAEMEAEPGSFEYRIDARTLTDAYSLLLTSDDEEFHFHSFLDDVGRRANTPLEGSLHNAPNE